MMKIGQKNKNKCLSLNNITETLLQWVTLIMNMIIHWTNFSTFYFVINEYKKKDEKQNSGTRLKTRSDSLIIVSTKNTHSTPHEWLSASIRVITSSIGSMIKSMINDNTWWGWWALRRASVKASPTQMHQQNIFNSRYFTTSCNYLSLIISSQC